MSLINGQVTFYGVKDINKKLDNIMNDLDLKENYFEVKLIICEAINNSYIHGNNRDDSKAIHVKWKLKDRCLTIIVKDCGNGIKNININNEINDESLLDDSGRGLHIINCYTDELIFDGNSIIMKKNLLCNC